MQNLCAQSVRSAIWHASAADAARPPPRLRASKKGDVFDDGTCLVVHGVVGRSGNVEHVDKVADVQAYAQQYDAAARALVGAPAAGALPPFRTHAFGTTEVYDGNFRYAGNTMPPAGTRVVARLGFWFTKEHGTRVVVRAVKAA